MILTKYFSLFGLSISPSKNIFIFKCGSLNDSNNLNLYLQITFLKNLELAEISKYSVLQA